MSHSTWNESYASGQLPWDTGQPEPLLVEFVTSGAVTPGPALEIGAGTGTNAIWMAEHDFDVLGVDVSPLAVERAHTKMGGRALRCRFTALDILAAPPSGDPSSSCSTAVASTCSMSHAKGSSSRHESLPHWLPAAYG